MRRLGFREYLFVLCGLAASVPVLGVSLWAASRWQTFGARQSEADAARTLDLAAEDVRTRVEGATSELQSFARRVVVDGVVDAATRKLAPTSAWEKRFGLVSFGVVGVDGRMLGGSARDVSSSREILHELARTRRPVFSAIVPAQENAGTAKFEISVPIEDGRGAVIGMAFGEFRLPDLDRWVELSGSSAMTVRVLDGKGRELQRTASYSDEEGNAKTVRRLELLNEPWRIVLTRNLSPLRSEAQSSRLVGILAVLVALGLGLLAASRLALGLTRPIEEIVDGVAAVGNRDLTKQLRRTRRWEPREADTLVGSFRTMFDQLRQLLRAMRDSKEEMARSVTGMSGMLRAQRSSMDRQSQHLTELNATIRDVRDMASTSASRAIHVLALTADADELRAAGEKSVEQSLQGLKDIRDQTDAIVGTIAALLERTLEVGGIAEQVKDVSDQSSVVALNAAIQAMRAGEFGRGFETVADQMRSLSKRSIESSARIREILSNAEKAIRATAAITEDGGRRIQHGMELIQESGNQLRQLSVIVEDNSVVSSEIADAVQQQYTGFLDIAHALEGVDEAMKDTTLLFESAGRLSSSLLEAAERISAQVDAYRLE